MQGHAQASLVCRKLAAAVSQMPALGGALDLAESNESRSTWSESIRGKLNSKLVMSWAPQLTALKAHGSDVSIKGLAGFVAAASALQDVELSGLGDNEAAKADLIFQGSTSIRSMSILSGSKIPCLWPLSTESVSLHLEDLLAQNSPVTEQLLLHGVWCSLLRLPSLSSLHLDIDVMGSLKSRMMLPHLQQLSVTMWLEGWHTGFDDLAFLASQLIDVDLHVHIPVLQPSLQLGLIHELQRQEIALSSIRIIAEVQIPAAILRQWKGVCTDRLTLEEVFGDHCKTVLIKDGFSSE